MGFRDTAVTSLAHQVFEACRHHAPLVALEVGERKLTYAELSERALLTAALLRDSGADREAVGIVGQRRISSYVGIAGILYAGCHYTPINPKYNKARIAAVLRDANVRYLVGDREHLEMLGSVMSDPDTPLMAAVIVPEGRATVGSSWRDERSARAVAAMSAPLEVADDDLAYLLYTSGSTGVPKGVQVANANVLAFLRSMSAIYDLEPGFRASQTFDFSFDPSVSDMFFTWVRGGVLSVLPDDEVMLPHEYIRRERITFWNSVPSIANFMRKLGHLKPGVFPELRYSMFCGEQFPQSLADSWQAAAPNSTIENLYGPTEATIYISRHEYTAAEHVKEFRNAIIPIGQPFLGHRCALIDGEGQRVSAPDIGEIAFSGPQVTPGYLHDSAKTDSVFVKFPWDDSGRRWYKTGDLAFINSDGNLECIGRRDSQIKLGGRRIEIGEIEAVLARFPATRDAVVVPLRDVQQVVVGCVAFTTRPISKDEERRVRQESTQYLESIFFPKRLIAIEAMPLSPSGKTDRKALAVLAGELVSHDRTAR